jgi:hypothetical protein
VGIDGSEGLERGFEELALERSPPLDLLLLALAAEFRAVRWRPSLDRLGMLDLVLERRAGLPITLNDLTRSYGERGDLARALHAADLRTLLPAAGELREQQMVEQAALLARLN